MDPNGTQFIADVPLDPMSLFDDPTLAVKAVTAAVTSIEQNMKDTGMARDLAVMPSVVLTVTIMGKAVES